jgi:hypothetical protein
MDIDLEEQVRHRAYEIWQSEGCPHGRDFEHWHRASLEFVTLASPELVSPEVVNEEVLSLEAPVIAEAAAVKPAAKKQSAVKPAAAKTRRKSTRVSQMALN